MNTKIGPYTLILLGSLTINHSAMATSSGSACDFTITNNYDSTAERRIYVYKGSDTSYVATIQNDYIAYGSSLDFSCGVGEEKCNIRWDGSGGTNRFDTEHDLAVKDVDCDVNFYISHSTSNDY